MPGGFTPEEQSIIVIGTFIVSFPNFLGCLFTVLTYAAFREARNDGTALVLYLALSDLAQAVATSFLWGLVVAGEESKQGGSPGVFCQMQGSFLMFGLCASMLWGLVIGIYLFLVLYKSMDFERLQKYKILFHVFVWGYSLAACLIPLIANQYALLFPGNKYSLCLIGDPASSYRLLLYIPDTLVYTALVILYCLLQFRLYSSHNSHNSYSEMICRKMRIYLLTYVLINTFAIINRVQNFFFPDRPVYVLYLLQFLTQPMQGFLNGIAYAWNEPVFLEQYARLFKKCLPGGGISRPSNEEDARLINSIIYYETEPG